MAGLSPKLPLSVDLFDGHYALTKTHKELVAQNLKHLILTSPGERIMDPNFGVGLRQFLFEQNDISTKQSISQRIMTQVQEYLPYIELEEVLVFSDDETEEEFSANTILNKINIRIFYNFGDFRETSLLNISAA
jgi:phage baseplate assembly protein W